MAILTACQALSKSYSSRPVFSDLSFGIEEGDRVGLIGPNGSGKSTLLKILANIVEPDSGDVVSRKNLRFSYVSQEETFESGLSVEAVVRAATLGAKFEEYEREASIDSVLKQFGFVDRLAPSSQLSGGWQKKLALACGLVTQPDLILFDEPTNHLDLKSILWLEDLLKSSRISFVVISHDRAFLQGVANRMIELSPSFPQGFLNVVGSYQDYLVQKEEKLAEQKNLEKSLASKVRREIAWLSRGAKARETKSQARIDEAARLVDQLSETKSRNQNRSTIEANFQSSRRRTKELISAEGIEKSYSDRTLFTALDCLVTPGSRLGLVGLNGSGKTTLLKVLLGEIEPDKGIIKRADQLKAVWFQQDRKSLDKDKTLRESFNHDGDYVVYCGRKTHVTSWARKFSFRTEQLDLPISYLSGGEQSRILIANLMLQVADILILDEPTNDLDIQTLEVLEDCITEFPGAVLLVSHDRMMLDTVSDEILALNGDGQFAYCSDYNQCQNVLDLWEEKKRKAIKTSKSDKKSTRSKSKNGLSHPEKRLLKELPKQIEEMEEKLLALESDMLSPDYATRFEKLEELVKEQKSIKVELEGLYQQWQTLEDKASETV